MNYSTYRFTLDIHQTRSQVSIPVMFQDTWVQLFINLTDGGKPYKIEDGCTAVLYGKKADGTALVNECEIIENTRIVYTFNEQTATCIGSVGCEIRLYSKDGLKLTTPSFALLVEERVVEDDEIIESDSELSAIDRIFESEAERESDFAEMQEQVLEGEAERNRNFSAMYVRYSFYEDGTDYSETYTEGMNYIGLATGRTVPTDKSGYTWCKFISDTKRYLNGEGGTLELALEDSTIYYISGYDIISVTAPSKEYYTSHLFIDFPADAEEVGIVLPTGMPCYGTSLSTMGSGDRWEISIDSVGGALCMKKEVIS